MTRTTTKGVCMRIIKPIGAILCVVSAVSFGTVIGMGSFDNTVEGLFLQIISLLF